MYKLIVYMKNLKLIELAESFVKYFKGFNVKNIPDNFIKEYYILTNDNFISIVEFTKWLNINRKTMIANLQKNYIKDQEYFFVSLEDEIDCIKLYSKKNLDFTARSNLNETKINLYIFLGFYVIYCLNFLSWLLIYFYRKHYKNNFHNVLFLCF